jgi:hypothetical protein
MHKVKPVPHMRTLFPYMSAWTMIFSRFDFADTPLVREWQAIVRNSPTSCSVPHRLLLGAFLDKCVVLPFGPLVNKFIQVPGSIEELDQLDDVTIRRRNPAMEHPVITILELGQSAPPGIANDVRELHKAE